MGQHRRRPLSVLPSHSPSARLVYRYEKSLCYLDNSGFSNDTSCAVAYALGIYLLNLFLAFLTPKFDPSNEAVDAEMEDGQVGILPTKADEEFKPFIRRLPEFKFWYWATRAVVIGLTCTFFQLFDVPVFWPVLVMYWIILFVLTSSSHT